MAATLEIDELNRTGNTTHGVVNLNLGSADSPNLVVTPLTAVRAGQNSYVKYHKLHFTALNGASSISGLKIWMSAGSFKAGESIATNLPSLGYSYIPEAFATPVTTAYVANPMPSSEPVSANLSISGSLIGSLAAPGTSDIWKWQLQTALSTPPGATITKEITIEWSES